MIKWIIIVFLLWRVFLILPLLIGEATIPYREQDGYTRIWKFIKPYPPVNSVLLYPWANFDGVHYLAIAGEGYSANGRFFPLYPISIWLLTAVFGGAAVYSAFPFFSGLILSNLFFLLALIALSKLIILDYSKEIAKKTILFLLLFPTSFFFVSLYSESLFLLLALLSFYIARKGRWWVAGIVGLLLSTSRLVGILILPSLLLELCLQSKDLFHKKDYKQLMLKALPLLLIPLGLFSFMVYSNIKWQDPINFIHAQGTLANGRSVETFVFPLQTLFRYFKIFIDFNLQQFEWWVALLEVVCTLLAGFLIFIGYKQKIRASYLLFAFLCFIIPIISGTLSGMPRYVLILFPIFFSLALLKNKKFLYLYAAISIPLLFLLTLLFSKGYFIA